MPFYLDIREGGSDGSRRGIPFPRLGMRYAYMVIRGYHFGQSDDRRLLFTTDVEYGGCAVVFQGREKSFCNVLGVGKLPALQACTLYHKRLSSSASRNEL